MLNCLLSLTVCHKSSKVQTCRVDIFWPASFYMVYTSALGLKPLRIDLEGECLDTMYSPTANLPCYFGQRSKMFMKFVQYFCFARPELKCWLSSITDILGNTWNIPKYGYGIDAIILESNNKCSHLMFRHFRGALYGALTWISLNEALFETLIYRDVNKTLCLPVWEVTLPTKLLPLLCVHIYYLHSIWSRSVMVLDPALRILHQDHIVNN